MSSKGFNNCIKIHKNLPDGKITEKKLSQIIKIEIGLDLRTVRKYINSLIEFGFIRKIDYDIYERSKTKVGLNEFSKG